MDIVVFLWTNHKKLKNNSNQNLKTIDVVAKVFVLHKEIGVVRIRLKEEWKSIQTMSKMREEKEKK